MSKNIFPWLQQRLLQPFKLKALSTKLASRRSARRLSQRIPKKTLQQRQAFSAHAVYQQRAMQRLQRARRQQLNYKPIDSTSREASDKIAETLTYSLSRSETVDTLNEVLRKNHQMDEVQTQRRATQSKGKQPSITAPLINPTDIAYLSELKGDDLEAERLYRQALNSYKARLGPHHPKVAKPLQMLANLYYKQHKHTAAEALFIEALSIQQAAITEPVETAETLHALANLYRDQKQYSKADTCFQKALTIFRQQLGNEHAQTRAAYSDLMTMVASLIEQDQFSELTADLPPLELNTLSETYSWARPSWQQP